MRRTSPLRRVVVYAGAILLAIFWFSPFVLVVLGSTLPEVSLLSFPPDWFAAPPSLAAYKKELRAPVNPDVLASVIRWCREVAGS